MAEKRKLSKASGGKPSKVMKLSKKDGASSENKQKKLPKNQSKEISSNKNQKPDKSAKPSGKMFSKPTKNKVKGPRKSTDFERKKQTKSGTVLIKGKAKKNPALSKDGKKSFKKQDYKTRAPKPEELSKKERKLMYKSSKNNFELITKVKQIWEILRNSANKSKTEELAVQLFNLVKGKVNQLIYAHDTSRVIECLMALGSPEIKNKLFDELEGEIIKMAQSTYAKFFVIKILNYGTKEQRSKVMSSFKGQMIKLMKRKNASSVIELAYNDYANKAQRTAMIEEFYGPTFLLSKISEDQTLASIIEMDNSKRETILAFMKQTLLVLVGKEVIRHSIVHKLLLDYFTHCNENERTEMIEILRESVVEILHTHDGSRVGMKCVWHGSPKDRKLIIKSMKSHILKICKEKDGHLVLLAILDCVDDTKLINAVIVEEVLKNLKDIIFDPEGRKVILYLIAPRDKLYFHPDIIRILEEGDSNQISKKDKPVRQNEILKVVSSRLLSFFVENTKEFVTHSSNSIVGLAILAHCLGDHEEAYKSVAKLFVEPYPCSDSNVTHIIEDTSSHFFIKHLLKQDKAMTAKFGVSFCDSLLSIVPSENFVSWIECNRGTFVLTFLMEAGNERAMEKINEILKPVKKKLAKKKFLGANILLKKLKNIA